MNKSARRKALGAILPRAAVLRAAADRIGSETIESRSQLANYYVSKLALLGYDAVILTGFDLDGNVVCEKIVRGRLIVNPREAAERVGDFAQTGCPFFAAGRRFEGDPSEYREKASDECEALFKILYDYGSVLKEYVMVRGFDYTLMSGKPKNRFPQNDKT